MFLMIFCQSFQIRDWDSLLQKIRRLIGLDPGLQSTGWGLIVVEGNRLKHEGSGAICSDSTLSLSERLLQIHNGLLAILKSHSPDEAAVEETFVNKNPRSALKLGSARGVVLLTPALFGIPVSEYSANRVKKSVVGVGHATKGQVELMVKQLFPSCDPKNNDAVDALAIAVCHAHYSQTEKRWFEKNISVNERV